MDERKEFEKQFYNLYNFFHDKKNSFRQREVILSNITKVTIFRSQEFVKMINNNLESIKNLLPDELKNKPLDAPKLATYLLQNKLILRMELNPEDQVKKWPKRVYLAGDRNQKWVEDGFYTWNLKIKNPFNLVKMGIILGIIFTILLYPIWPFYLKFAVFKVSLYLLVFLVGLLVVRLIVYIISRLLGCSFWILPNILDDTRGLVGYFVPLYSYYKYTDGWVEIVLRIIGFFGVIFIIYFLYENPEYIYGFKEGSEQTIDDLIDWGKTKLEGVYEPIHKNAIPDLSDILREAENATDL